MAIFNYFPNNLQYSSVNLKMKKYILKVPISQDPLDWFNFVNQNLAIKSKLDYLTVDFNNIDFLETSDFVVLACLIETIHNENCEVTFIGGTKKFNKHLNNIKFKVYWNKGFNREQFTVSRNNTTLCLWKISEQRIYSYSDYAKKFFRDTFFNMKDLVPFAQNLQEVFYNIFDHSQSPISGYIISQYYPRDKKLAFSVCDFGIGIPTTINNYLLKKSKPVLNDEDALLMALERGFSIKSKSNNRGWGLNNILDFTEASNGLLEIVSNNGVVAKEANKKVVSGISQFNFKGTIIRVTVDSKTFEYLDEDDFISEF